VIVILDYGVGNLGSIYNMFRKAGVDAMVSSEVGHVESADRLILPGVGAFDNGMTKLHASGLLPSVTAAVMNDGKPILGICLGMQLLGRRSEEGECPGLGWLDAETVRFRLEECRGSLKVPHMGWNETAVVRPSPLFQDVSDDQRFYFLHSYYLRCDQRDDVIAETVYGHSFTSVAGRENVYGVQFHPEKSHRFGLQLLRNFAEHA